MLSILRRTARKRRVCGAWWFQSPPEISPLLRFRRRSPGFSPFLISAVDFGVLSTNLSAAGWAHNQSATPECFDASADSIRKRCSERSSREGEAEHLVLGLPGEPGRGSRAPCAGPPRRGAARADREAVADQLAAAAGENRRSVDQARTLLLVAVGGESSDAAAVWRYAAEDCHAAVASGIGSLQSTANCDDEIGGKGISV